MKNWMKEASTLALGLVLTGSLLCNAINNFTDKDRMVSVKGLAEMEVMANKVTWPLMHKTVGNNLTEIYNKTNQTNQVILDYLKKHGISETEISVNAPEIIDLKADRWNNKEIAYRYNVTCVITVTSKQVEKVRQLINRQSELLKQGIAISGGDYRYNISYDYTDLNLIKPQMIEEATKKAREAGQKFAKDSQSELGKIKHAYQGQFSIEDRDANTPYIKKVRVVTTIDYYLKD